MAKLLTMCCKDFTAFYSTFTASVFTTHTIFGEPMTGLEHFTRLKQQVLSEYRKHYPYSAADWKSFSSQDIQNLMALIEDNLRQTVSEKWIYTHLKPAENEKLPRKDMLDIFSRFCGYSGWDEFSYETVAKQPTKKLRIWMLALGIGLLMATVSLAFFWNRTPDKQIKVTDQYTGKPLQTEEFNVFQADSVGEKPVPIQNGSVLVPGEKKTVLVVKSPYYRTRKVVVDPASGTAEIKITPDDQAMMLKAFMQSDIKDWQTRKVQLDRILSDDLEVIVMLKDNLGAEYFNKREFAQKLIVPTPSLRQYKIIELKHGTDQKIQFIRMAQQ